MSLVELEKRHLREATVTIPPLAVELWTGIFHWATVVPDDMLQPELAFTENDKTYSIPKHTQDRYRSSIRTKLALVQVCRDWHTLSARLLHEHIQITAPEQLEALIDVFSRQLSRPKDLATNAVDPGCLGDHVRRLDILIPDAQGFHPLPILMRLRASLSKLKTLIFTSTTSWSTHGDLPLSDFFPSTLQFIASLGKYSISPTQWFALLETCPSLYVLKAPVVNLATATIEAGSSSSKTFPGLRTLIVDDADQFALEEMPKKLLYDSTFPNLQTLVIMDLTRVWDTTLGSLLRPLGRQLTTLHLRVHVHIGVRSYPMSRWLCVVKEHCPALREIRLTTEGDADRTHRQMDQPFAIRGVITIGIQRQCRNPDMSDPWHDQSLVEALLQDAGLLADCCPDLQRILMLSEDNVSLSKDPGCEEVLGIFLVYCRSKSWDVLDHLGNLLN